MHGHLQPPFTTTVFCTFITFNDSDSGRHCLRSTTNLLICHHFQDGGPQPFWIWRLTRRFLLLFRLSHLFWALYDITSWKKSKIDQINYEKNTILWISVAKTTPYIRRWIHWTPWLERDSFYLPWNWLIRSWQTLNVSMHKEVMTARQLADHGHYREVLMFFFLLSSSFTRCIISDRRTSLIVTKLINKGDVA